MTDDINPVQLNKMVMSDSINQNNITTSTASQSDRSIIIENKTFLSSPILSAAITLPTTGTKSYADLYHRPQAPQLQTRQYDSKSVTVVVFETMLPDD